MTHPQQTTREVLEQCVQALNHCMDAITERGLNGSPDQAEKWGLQLPLVRAESAITAARSVLAHNTPSTAGERAEAAISLHDAWMYFTGAEPSLSRLGQAIDNAAALLQFTALPAGELTLEQITRIYERYGGDMVNCTRAIERELAAASSQPVREPELEHVNCDDCTYHYKDADQKPCNTCVHSGDFCSNFEPRHGITKKGAQ